MELKYDYWTGSMNVINAKLNRSISQFLSWNKKVKIGVTHSPERRMKEHKRSGVKWDYMVVIYKSTSIYFVSELERRLVEKYWDSYNLKNKIGGGGGSATEGDQYLYVLIKS